MANEEIGINLTLNAKASGVDELSKNLERLSSNAEKAQQSLEKVTIANTSIQQGALTESPATLLLPAPNQVSNSVANQTVGQVPVDDHQNNNDLISSNQELASDIKQLIRTLKEAKNSDELLSKEAEADSILQASLASDLEDSGLSHDNQSSSSYNDTDKSSPKENETAVNTQAPASYQALKQTQSLMQSIQNTAGQLGQGNGLGASAALVGGVGELAAGLSNQPIVGAVAAVAAGSLSTIDALSQLYEKYIPYLRNSQYRSNWTRDKDGNLLDGSDRIHLASMAAEASGLSISTMFEVSEAFARQGIINSEDGKNQVNRDKTMEVGRYEGFYVGSDINQMATSLAKTTRYEAGDILEAAAAVNNSQNNNAVGMYDEVLHSLGRLFDNALSKGITIENITDLAKAEVGFGSLGKQWQGDMGAERIIGISNTLSSASLSSQTGQLIQADFRDNWDERTKGTKWEGTGYSLDKGLLLQEDLAANSPEIFTQLLLNKFKALAGDDALTLLNLVKGSFGLSSYTEADQLINGTLTSEQPLESPDLEERTDKELERLVQGNTVEVEGIDKGEGALEIKIKTEKLMKDMMEKLDKSINDLTRILQSPDLGAMLADAIKSGFSGFISP